MNQIILILAVLFLGIPILLTYCIFLIAFITKVSEWIGDII